MTYLLNNTDGKRIGFAFVEVSADYAHTSGDIIKWDSVTATDSTSRVSVSAFRVTLQPGDYILQGNVAIDRTNAGQTYEVQFYDDSTNVILTESDGFYDAQTWTLPNTGSLVLQAQVSLSSALAFYITSTGAGGDVLADGSSLLILEL